MFQITRYGVEIISQEILPLYELYKKIREESSWTQPKPQERHHQAGSSLSLLPPDHLWSAHHADRSNIAVRDTEKQHDDNVGNVALKSHESDSSLCWPNITEEEEGDENNPETTSGKNKELDDKK